MQEQGQMHILKLETEIVDTKGNKTFKLSFPPSRLKRDFSKLGEVDKLKGFHGKIQADYNLDPVGQYAGPYDQNEKLDLAVRSVARV